MREAGLALLPHLLLHCLQGSQKADMKRPANLPDLPAPVDAVRHWVV